MAVERYDPETETYPRSVLRLQEAQSVSVILTNPCISQSSKVHTPVVAILYNSRYTVRLVIASARVSGVSKFSTLDDDDLDDLSIPSQ